MTSLLTGDAVRDARNVDALLRALADLQGRGELDALVRSAVDGAILVTGAQRGVLLLPERGGALGVRVARDRTGADLASDLRYSRSVAQRVWTTGQASLTMDAERGNAVPLGSSILDLRLLSILAVPLRVKSKQIGVLYVDSTAAAKEFSVGDRLVFEALAGIVAIAIEQARLAAEEAIATRLHAEVDVARKIQLSQHPSHIVAPEGYRIAAEGRPCVETSGDYHDVIARSDGTIALIVGDVSGHGLGAALYMASARAVLRSLLHAGGDALESVAALNDYLCRDMPSGTFMSLVLALLDPSARTLSFINAGQTAPVLARGGGEWIELGPTGPVLGVIPGHAYRLGPTIRLAARDTLLLFTDGLVEAVGTDGSLYGEERLRASLAARAALDLDASDVVDGVLRDLSAFVGDRPMEDDLTCVVLQAVDVPARSGGGEGSARR